MNIQRILAFDTIDHNKKKERIEIDELRQRSYSIKGTNDYFDLAPTSPLDKHEEFFRRTVDLYEGEELTIMLGVQPVLLTSVPLGSPPLTEDALAHKKATQALKDAANQAQLAKDLGAALSRAKDYAKDRMKLRFVVRIASEMNVGTGNIWSNAPLAFKPAYNTIAANIKQGAGYDPSDPSRILFSFSPGIQRHVDPAEVKKYWPGPNHVDLIGCTWYTRLFSDASDKDPDGQKAFDKLNAYFSQFLAHGLDYCIDEFGCCNSSASSEAQNVAVYRKALARLETLSMGGRSLEHVTLFAVDDWKVDIKKALK